jgi:N-acetylglucosaminyldiphosphoundecaprenol N-acetyl-beta-D-mannosaminyltransferase
LREIRGRLSLFDMVAGAVTSPDVMAGAVTNAAGIWSLESAPSRPLEGEFLLARDRSDAGVVHSDDLSREVYCIFGIPVDAIDMPAVLSRIEAAAAGAAPFVISTPNLNFLVNSQVDPEFRESLLLSDLCPADGMPIVWIAWLSGIPIKARVAGSDIFDALKAGHGSARPLRVFLFGGLEGVAAAAARALNVRPGGLQCVGSMFPGFGTLDEMSRDQVIDEINASHADFLVASLGARKGQVWLQRNRDRLRVPLMAHLGAVMNFQAGTIKRAPSIMREYGLEWLWRIKEEPHLWRRYWNDGCVLLRLMLTRVLPLVVATLWQRLRYERKSRDLVIRQAQSHDSVTLSLYGVATALQVNEAIPCFRAAAAENKQIVIDLSETRAIDARFVGLLLMLRKQLKGRGAGLKFVGVSSRLRRMFRLNGVAFLLSEAGA